VTAEVTRLVADLTRNRRIGQVDDLWDTVVDLGLTGIGIPEEAAGSGGSLIELATVVTEFAARGARFPLVERAVAQWALQSDPRWQGRPATVAVTAGAVAPQSGHLTATVPRVRGMAGAQLVVLISATQVPPLVLDCADPRVSSTAGVDLAGIRVDELSARAATVVELSVDPRSALALLATLRAAAIVGAARSAYELTRDHVRTRHQFGRALIDLPAVAAALATLRVELLQARTAVDAALAALVVGDPARVAAVGAAARVITGDAAGVVAAGAHQLHGAIGITREYTLHHLTTLLWATRDADLPEQAWATRLGAALLAAGEHEAWDVHTAPAAMQPTGDT
jgi:alkylation response protein AidB-like acyl-CoA dehydrogenase